MIDYLLNKLRQLRDAERYLLGITGSPGAGKSTVAEILRNRINAQSGNNVAIVVPMDGFHLRNAILHERGIWHLKGIPETFDADGFLALLEKLRKETNVATGCPAFDRQLEEPTENAIMVTPQHRLLIVEGNYLLYEKSPWHRVKLLLDEIWFIEAPLDTIVPRLLERHIKGGRTPEAARGKMEETDLANARLIEATRRLADRSIRPAELDRLIQSASAS